MSDISSVSRSELSQRRKQLRQQRRRRIFQVSWRTVMMGGVTMGLLWAVSRPDWMLRHPSQVIVEGNKFLSAETIRSLLPVDYPQFLLTLQPKAIAQSLESQAPIAEVGVTRRLFPPSLTIRIQERYPVALVYPVPADGATVKPIALLDEKGYLIPYEKYIALNRSRQLPTLQVIGIGEAEQAQWGSLYELVSRSPVKVEEIDWRDRGNLILRTEMGYVKFGAYGEQFAEQLKVLDQMRQLPKVFNAHEVAFINLRNPKSPLLELGQPGVHRLPTVQKKPDDEAAPEEGAEVETHQTQAEG